MKLEKFAELFIVNLVVVFLLGFSFNLPNLFLVILDGFDIVCPGDQVLEELS